MFMLIGVLGFLEAYSAPMFYGLTFLYAAYKLCTGTDGRF